MSTKKLSVQVINLNTIAYTRDCIFDLLDQSYNDFDIYLVDQHSQEPATESFLRLFEEMGVKVIRNPKQVTLNQQWNNFKNTCQSEYLCFLNNDIRLSKKFIEDTIDVFNMEPNVGMVIHITNNPEYIKTKDKLVYSILRPPYFQGWDVTIKRELIPEIPAQLKIFGGDDYVAARIVNAGYDIALVYSSPIIHYSQRSRVKIPDIEEVHQKDSDIFYQILKDEGLKYVESIISTGHCKTLPQPGMEII